MAEYLTPCTVSGPSLSFNLSGRCSLSIDFVDRIRAFSPNSGTLIKLAKKSDATTGRRYSFREVFASLDETERAAAESERASFDLNLKLKLEKGEISRLCYYRRLARMTQEQLAERSGSRQAFLCRVEKRKRTLTWKQAEKFAAALGIDPAQLMEKR